MISDGRSRIWLKDLIRGEKVALTAGPKDDDPRFSPDGSMILSSRGKDGLVHGLDKWREQNALYRISVFGRRTTQGAGRRLPRRRLVTRRQARGSRTAPVAEQIVNDVIAVIRSPQ
jgi:dipeptidyl aminopeptidase/acylaminoacyl peptidase